MADLGKVVVTDGGTYSASVTYEKLTFVHYNGDAYLTLKTVKGVTPTDDGTNYRLFCKSAVTATTSKAGIVMPDGSTISISNGKISAKKATQSAVGVVKGSDDINVDSNGEITVNTEFTQATALANLIAGEAIKVVLGKVSKAIATTMNLDQNALLKNMVSGIDANDGNKIPSSAFVHTLYERLGMGTDLSAGDAKNVTQAVNSLYSNLKYLNGGYSARITRIKNIQVNDYYVYIDLDTSDLPVNKKLSEYPMILVAVNTNTVAEPILYADRAGDRKIRVVFAGTITGTINLCLQYSVSPV